MSSFVARVMGRCAPCLHVALVSWIGPDVYISVIAACLHPCICIYIIYIYTCDSYDGSQIIFCISRLYPIVFGPNVRCDGGRMCRCA